jgi:hypothetical protein
MRRFMSLVAAVLVSASAGAQSNPHVRQGFTIGFGLGLGSGEISGTSGSLSVSSGRKDDLTGYLRIGGAINENLVLAGEASGSTHGESGATGTLAFVSFVALLYPASTADFYLKAGAGIAKTEISGFGLTYSATGYGLTGGLGYDIRVARNFSLSPFAAYLYMPGADVSGIKLGGNLLQVGLGVTWH